MMTKELVVAGKAKFTVSNPKGEHYTYRVTKKENTGDKIIYFVSFFSGCDNDRHYSYLGLLNPIFGNVYVTKKSRYQENSLQVKIIRWAMKIVFSKGFLPAGYKIDHAGKCCRCGRTLTTPESIQDGIGPECKKVL